MKSDIKKLLRSVRMITMIVLVFLSLLFISNIIPLNKESGGQEVGIGFGNGLDFGLDFVGGTQLQLRLEPSANNTLSPDMLELEKSILEKRLNSMGLKDIPVRPWGEQFILVQVASASPEEIASIENILKQQANFEARVAGERAILGSEISMDLQSGSSGMSQSSSGTYSWHVGIKLSREGGERFCEVAADKFNQPIDMFLDRPVNALIAVDPDTYSALDEIMPGDNARSDTFLELIQNRSQIPVIVIANNSLDESILGDYPGFDWVILAEDTERISEDVRNRFEELNYSTSRNPRDSMDWTLWVNGLVGLTSSPTLSCDPCRECKYSARITGAAGTRDEALAELDESKILLSSGNLPAKAVVDSKSEFPSSLGNKFLKYSFITGLIALLTVAIVIYLRYRELSIVVPTIITGFSEIIITLGLAALINWQIDLPGIAGIIAAVGTGVDDQIVITDETLRRSKKEEEKYVNLVARIRKAFFIIFTAAATTIAVMLPVFSIQALKGFAFMTSVGVLIGVFVTRPAYAKIIEVLLKE